MSNEKMTDSGEHISKDTDVKGDVPPESEILDQSEGKAMPSSLQEEEVLKKKYGGIIPKKPPLISKDHERAFFDSADWALGKQGGHQKPKGPLEALRPKLQPTQQQTRSRRSAYASTDNEDGGNAASMDANDNDNDGEAAATTTTTTTTNDD